MTKKLVDNDDENESLMTDEQFAEVERRVKSFEAGESKMISWKKLKARILKKGRKKTN